MCSFNDMSSITIWHNPRCSKSRQTLQLIVDSGAEPTIVEYLKTPPSKAELTEALQKLGLERPIVFRGKRAVIGRPPENVLDLLA